MARFWGNSIAVDTETTGVKVWHGDQPFAVSMCNDEGETKYWEWPVDPYTRVVIYDEAELEEIESLLLDTRIGKVFHNGKFDVRMFENVGMRLVANDQFLGGRIDETMFMAHCTDSLEGDLGLKELSEKYLEVDREDQAFLQKTVGRLRREAAKLGWNIAYEEKELEDGTIEKKAAVEADYWLPQAFKLHGGVSLTSEEAEVCRKYALLDAERTMMLKLLYDPLLDERGARGTYEKEMQLWPIVYLMEKRGVRLDRTIVEREEQKAHTAIHEHRKALIKAAWPTFNPKSPKDLGKLLYDREYLNLEVKRRTEKSKQPATNVDALHDYESHPVVGHLVKMRSNHKAWSSFFRKYRKLSVRAEDGSWEIHTDFRQMGPATGRFSSATPNLQNVANALTTRSSEPIQARTPFGPRPDHLWFHWDYHQIEVRIFADVSQEQFMIDAIRDGRDLHTECANKVWGGETDAAVRAAFHSLELDGSGTEHSPLVLSTWKDLGINAGTMHRYGRKDLDKLAALWLNQHGWNIVKAEKSLEKKTSRAKAKMVLFGKQFGGGPNAIKDLIRCTYEEAAQVMDDYDVAFPRIKEYIDELSEEALANGFILTNYGRRLTINPEFAYRAVNYKVQGSAADLMKASMLKVAKFYRECGLPVWLVLTIHDELASEIMRRYARRDLILKVGQLMADNEGHFGLETPVELSLTTTSWDKKDDAPWCKGVAMYADGTLRKKS